MASNHKTENEEHANKTFVYTAEPNAIVPIPFEEIESEDLDFNNKITRRTFICIVYFIIVCQQLFTIGIVLVVTYPHFIKEYIESNLKIYKIMACVLIVVTYFPLVCYEFFRRMFPINLIFFSMYTIGISLFSALFLLPPYPEHTLYGHGLSALICITLTVFAYQTKKNFTSTISYVLVAVLVFVFMSIFAIIFWEYLIRLLISTTAVIIFTFSIIYDTQLMVTGEHEYSITPDEYLMPAISMHVDFFYILLHVFGLIGNSQIK